MAITAVIAATTAPTCAIVILLPSPHLWQEQTEKLNNYASKNCTVQTIIFLKVLPTPLPEII